VGDRFRPRVVLDLLVVSVDSMKYAHDLIPWNVTDISIRPYEGLWSFNPSIHFDGDRWLCTLRCADYAMPGGVTIRSKSSRVGQQTKNAMVLFDSTTWQPKQIFKMHEKDGLARETCSHAGFEDMRIFWTAKHGLQGIAASLHLKRGHRTVDGKSTHQPPEQVLLSFDDQFDIVAARPIRGDGWSGSPQKNWVPFNFVEEPRFLYSIDKGTMFSVDGALHGAAARATHTRPQKSPIEDSVLAKEAPSAETAAAFPAPTVPAPQTPRERSARRPPPVRGGDVRILRGGRMAIDTVSSRPASRAASVAFDGTRRMGGGRIALSKYPGLRGGSQLVRVDDDAWLGIGHEMKFVNAKKYYWHAFYLVDSTGSMLAVSEPFKLVQNGIEFAAGMALDGDRLVISFGVDDMECRIGETRLSAVMERLHSIAR